MKITKRKLKQLIEAFIAGPKGTINLNADPYEFMKHHPDPRISAIAGAGSEHARQAALLSDREDDYEYSEYEAGIRNDPDFDPKKYSDEHGFRVSRIYAIMMSLYDNNPNFEKNLKEKIFDRIGNSKDQRYLTLQQTAATLAEYYNDDIFDPSGFFDIETILEYEAESYLRKLLQEDPILKRLNYPDHKIYLDYHYHDEVALNQKGRKTLEQIVQEAYEESGLADELEKIYYENEDSEETE